MLKVKLLAVCIVSVLVIITAPAVVLASELANNGPLIQFQPEIPFLKNIMSQIKNQDGNQEQNRERELNQEQNVIQTQSQDAVQDMNQLDNQSQNQAGSQGQHQGNNKAKGQKETTEINLAINPELSEGKIPERNIAGHPIQDRDRLRFPESGDQPKRQEYETH